ncbi:MAG: hypothetical protein WBM21_01965, partial [Christensenellales bacterium]
ILDMLGEPMEFDLGPDGMGVIPPQYLGTLNLMQSFINELLASVTNAIEDEAVVGSPIYIMLNNGTVLTLTPSNESRGVLKYMSMAWLDSNDLIFAITAFMAVRRLFLIFAGVLVVTTFAIGLLRDDSKEEKKKAVKDRPLSDTELSVLDRDNLKVEYFRPYDPSQIVITQSLNKLDFNKMNTQLLYDSQYKVTKQYSDEEFIK